MPRPRSVPTLKLLAPVLGAALSMALVPGVALVPGAGPSTTLAAQAAASDGRDFLFDRPSFSFTARMGAFLPRAESQFHDFVFDLFTVERGDLQSFTGGIEAGIWLSDRTEAILSIDGASVTRPSTYYEEDWMEETAEGLVPIHQTTRIVQGPTLSLGARFFPLQRGENLARFVWAPHRVAPFVSGGVGGTGYRIEQWGDWVAEPTDPEAEDAEIFTADYYSEGAGFIKFVGAGVDLQLRTRLALTVEGRYFWGQAQLSDDFSNFMPLDLSGLRLTGGLSFRY
ncbi:MAG: hypothetical protein WD960_07700 [Gemmatimonadota bacterium]